MKGIRKRPHSYQVYARRNGKYLSKSFPLDTTVDLERERDKLIGREALGLPDPDPTGNGTGFAKDADAYLKLVTHMPSYSDREYRINQWADALGRYERSAITPAMIRAVLEQWRLKGRADGTGGLSPGSLNLRRTALMHLFTVLNGRGGVNPVKDVPAYDESDSEQIRAHDPKTLHRIIRLTGQPTRNLLKTRARLLVMFWTGWPHAQLMRLTEADVDWKGQSVWIRGRKKGKGSKARRLPLIFGQHAVAALRRFFRLDAHGKFSQSAMHKTWRVALAKVNKERAALDLPAIKARPYDIRHSVGTELAKIVKDERAIQEFMLLANLDLVRRYTEAATSQRLEEARAKVAQKRPKRVRTRKDSVNHAKDSPS